MGSVRVTFFSVDVDARTGDAREALTFAELIAFSSLPVWMMLEVDDSTCGDGVVPSTCRACSMLMARVLSQSKSSGLIRDPTPDAIHPVIMAARLPANV